MMDAATIKKQRFVLGLLFLLMILTMVISMGLGYSSLSYERLLPTLLGYGTEKETFILYSIRLPRVMIVTTAGIALALSGTILQSITRNDLADPGIIGINSGAGVAITIYFLFMPIDVNSFVYVLPLIAFCGALLAVLLIYVFSYQKKEGLNPTKFILVGIGFSFALSGAMIFLISSTDRTKVDFIAKWLAGDIWGTDWLFLWAILPWLLVLAPLTFAKSNRLDLLRLSEPLSISLGVHIEKERMTLLVIAVALAASAVSVTGGISFIGLMSPHIARALVGPQHRLCIPVAMLLGGWLLLLADTISRNLLSPSGIPAGIVVALIGAPYFIYLLMRSDTK